MIKDAILENISVEKNSLRVGLLQLLSLEKKYAQET